MSEPKREVLAGHYEGGVLSLWLTRLTYGDGSVQWIIQDTWDGDQVWENEIRARDDYGCRLARRATGSDAGGRDW
jgi:hypothetical protein